MSGLSNFGEFISNGTADKSSRAYNEVARQYNAAVDDMFASLHAENGTLKPQKQKMASRQSRSTGSRIMNVWRLHLRQKNVNSSLR